MWRPRSLGELLAHLILPFLGRGTLSSRGDPYRHQAVPGRKDDAGENTLFCPPFLCDVHGEWEAGLQPTSACRERLIAGPVPKGWPLLLHHSGDINPQHDLDFVITLT